MFKFTFSIGFIIDHNNKLVIYGDIIVIQQLEKSLEIEAKMFENENNFLDELYKIVWLYPNYLFKNANHI